MFRTVSNGTYAPVAASRLDTGEWQRDVVFTPSSDGGYVAIWADGGWPNTIQAQRFDRNGRKVGPEFIVGEGYGISSVAEAPAGGFIVSWVGAGVVKARLYDADANPLGASFTVSSAPPGPPYAPQVSALADGGYVVIWNHQVYQNFSHQVRAQVLSSTGAKVGAELIVAENQFYGPALDVVGLAGGGFVMTWTDADTGPDASYRHMGVRAQLFSASGAKLGDPFWISDPAPGAQDDAELLALPNGGFAAVWADDGGRYGSIQTFSGSEGVWLQLFDELGQKVGNAVRMGEAGIVPHTPKITATATGFFVVWSESPSGAFANPALLKGQFFDFSGHAQGDAFELGAAGAALQYNPSALVLENGNVVLGWNHETYASSQSLQVQSQLLIPVTRGTPSADAFAGTADRDYYAAGTGADVVAGGVEDDGLAGEDGDDRLDGGAGDDLLYGDGGDDVLEGGEGNDLLDGGDGSDAMTGGAGNDVYLVQDLGDGVVEAAERGTDEVRTSLAAYTLGDHFEKLTGTSTFGQALTGNALNNVIQGGAGDDLLIGGGGSDTIAAGAGNDTAIVTGGTNAGDTGVAIVHLSVGTDRLIVDYGAITENVVMTNPAHGFDGAESVLTVGGATRLSFTGANVMTLTTGSGNDKIYSINAADIISSGAGNDEIQAFGAWLSPQVRIDAGEGRDVVNHVDWEDLATAVVLDFNDPQGVTIGSGTNERYLRGVEAIWGFWTGFGDDVIVLHRDASLHNSLGTYFGNDTVTVYGGATRSATGSAQVSLGEGVDHLISDFSAATVPIQFTTYYLTGLVTIEGADLHSYSEVERITLIAGSQADLLDGREQGSSITSISLAFDGRGGDDSLYGGTLADSLSGGSGADMLDGGAGDDSLDGGTGADSMAGGAGNDVYVVDDSGDSILENANEGTDEIRTGLGAGSNQPLRIANQYQLAANVENLTGTGLNQGLRGNGLNNVITAAAGADFVNLSDGGDDTVTAGDGRDVLYYGGALTSADSNDAGAAGGDPRGDLIILQGDYSAGMTLGAAAIAGIEKFRVLRGNQTDFGDTANNFYDYVIKTVDSNVADGGRLVVQAGSLRVGETLTFDGSAETDGSFQIFGGRDGDTIEGGAQFDHLLGRNGDDHLIGNGGGDRLRGGLGKDLLEGGAGADIFVYAAQGGAEGYANAALESSSTGYDTIDGFVWDEDRIDLPTAVSSIGTDTSGALSQATFDADLVAALGSFAASSAVLFTPDSGDLAGRHFLVVDANGDGGYQANVDFVFEMQGAVGTLPATPDFFI